MFRNISPQEAIKRLIEGNQRYVDELAHAGVQSVHRAHLMAEQRPFAIVLGCSDSRVPVEIVFGQSLGDLFVIRNAGQVLNDHVVGSIEYAVGMFGSPLVVVLGHSSCGAVTAAVGATIRGEAVASPAIAEIVESIRPAVESVRHEEDVLEAAIGAHVRSVVAELRESQPILRPAIERNELRIVGAEYHLGSGRVTLMEEALQL